MNLLNFIGFGLIIFVSLLFAGKKFRSTGLYLLAIAGIINANYFYPTFHPIDIFGYPFGLDSILYNLFIFCVVIMYFEKGKKEAYLLSATSVIAVFLTAIIKLINDLLTVGHSKELLLPFIGFTLSCILSLVIFLTVIELISFIKKKKPNANQYLLMIISLVITSIIYPLVVYLYEGMLTNNFPDPSVYFITGSIGRIMTIGFSCLTLFLMHLYDKRIENRK